jgi:hypothetical protein
MLYEKSSGLTTMKLPDDIPVVVIRPHPVGTLGKGSTLDDYVVLLSSYALVHGCVHKDTSTVVLRTISTPPVTREL